jgi:hypothetical protein
MRILFAFLVVALFSVGAVFGQQDSSVVTPTSKPRDTLIRAPQVGGWGYSMYKTLPKNRVMKNITRGTALDSIYIREFRTDPIPLPNGNVLKYDSVTFIIDVRALEYHGLREANP